jgi:hypothetical protein
LNRWNTTDSSHISKFGIGFDLDQHRNTPNPTSKKIVKYSDCKLTVQTVNSEIEKIHKQELQGKDDFHITRIRKNKRAEKVNSCMTCTNKGYYGHTRGLCGSRIQRTKGKLNKKEYDHNKDEILQVKKETRRLAKDTNTF